MSSVCFCSALPAFHLCNAGGCRATQALSRGINLCAVHINSSDSTAQTVQLQCWNSSSTLSNEFGPVFVRFCLLLVVLLSPPFDGLFGAYGCFATWLLDLLQFQLSPNPPHSRPDSEKRLGERQGMSQLSHTTCRRPSRLLLPQIIWQGHSFLLLRCRSGAGMFTC